MQVAAARSSLRRRDGAGVCVGRRGTRRPRRRPAGEVRRATRRTELGRVSAKWPPARAVSSIGILGRHRLPSRKIPIPDKALRRRRHPRAGVADRAGSKFFKAVQSGSKFEVRAFKVCANFSNFAPPEAQEHRLSSDFLEQPRTPLRNAALPRR